MNVSSYTINDVIKEICINCNHETKRFISPIINNLIVQKLLISCYTSVMNKNMKNQINPIDNDPITLEEWIWYPPIRQRLEEISNIKSKDSNVTDNLISTFEKASIEQENLAETIMTPLEIAIQDAKISKDRGTVCFYNRNIYAALNAYKETVKVLEIHVLGQTNILYTMNDQQYLDEASDIYIKCCVNIGICAIRRNDLTTAREYLNKAIYVDNFNVKAYVNLARTYSLEHRYQEAREILSNIENKFSEDESDFKIQMKNINYMKIQIDNMEEQYSKNLLNTYVSSKMINEKNNKNNKKEMDQSENNNKTQEISISIDTKTKVPLPKLDDANTNTAAALLNNYFLKIKAPLLIDYDQKYDPHKSESPLFGCRIYGFSNQYFLAEAEASSKKQAKHLASKKSIEMLWKNAIKKDLLLFEDQMYLRRKNGEDIDALSQENPDNINNSEKSLNSDMTTNTIAPEPFIEPANKSKKLTFVNGFSEPIVLTHQEKMDNPVSVLNKLYQQKKMNLCVRFEFKTEVKNFEPEFECFGYLEDELIGSEKAPSKKAARTKIAAQILRKVEEKRNKGSNEQNYPLYSHPMMCTRVPRHTFPEKVSSPSVAYQVIKDELLFDGNPKMNLASFVTTYMEPEAESLMAEAMAKNYIDLDQYPQTANFQNHCVDMLCRLYNAPLTDNEHGTGTGCIGSSEAIMLSGLAMKKKWQIYRKSKNLSIENPNIVFGCNAQISLYKMCKYFEIEPRAATLSPNNLVLTAERAKNLINENTIGVIAILGSTINGEYEDVKSIHDMVVDLNHKNNWNIPIHVDAATGGFIAPFITPELEWDFRLPNVKSINSSGHKFGLVYPGIGWALWREKVDLPEELVFHINYLGGDQTSFTLNFSKGASNVVGQYYNFLRLGREGYASIMKIGMETAQYLRESLLSTGHFEIVDKGQTPVVVFKLKNTTKYTCFDIQDKLRVNGWIVPAYTCPEDAESMVVMRAVVKQNFSHDLADMLVHDIKKAIRLLDKQSDIIMKNKDYNNNEHKNMFNTAIRSIRHGLKHRKSGISTKGVC